MLEERIIVGEYDGRAIREDNMMGGHIIGGQDDERAI